MGIQGNRERVVRRSAAGVVSSLCQAKIGPLDFFHTKSTDLGQLAKGDFSSCTQPIDKLSIWIA